MLIVYGGVIVVSVYYGMELYGKFCITYLLIVLLNCFIFKVVILSGSVL